MTTPILICDDSGFARKQMARSIPEQWDVSISYASNGQEALDAIQAGHVELMFLDLNMPVLDGYQTMLRIQQQQLSVKVIVVSGDVQPEARKRMMAMGALEFIRKPIDNVKLYEILSGCGIYSGNASPSKPETITTPENAIDKLDAYREMANVAMGQAGEKLAQLLDVFIELPIPNVNIIESTELHMAIAEIQQSDSISAISQGFISAGINGEALLLFNDSNFANMVRLLKYDQAKITEQIELEALMDISNILIGACLHALSEQLHVKFGQNHPMILGRHCDLEGLLHDSVSRWNKVVAIEIAYSIENQDIHFDLMLLFPDKAMEIIFKKLVNLVEL
ncbi:response regulator [Planctobacterium marinum]|uniref:Response regulator n=1 Tax=Planctobacterium marinum TaxID=1631968 RepID=A0AA48HL67_9ALTE|nr:response regulator [Planctobacterium marinum]